MTTEFSTLPIVDLSPLSDPEPSSQSLKKLSTDLDRVFRSTGFAYLTNPPLSFSHEDVFGLAREFFMLPDEGKMKAAKRMFVDSDPRHQNTYRGYFPPQHGSPDNLKEGFEMGPGKHDNTDVETRNQVYQACNQDNCAQGASMIGALPETPQNKHAKASAAVQLNEANVWPPPEIYPLDSRAKLEQLYKELQSLSRQLLSLLAEALGQSPQTFEIEGWMDRSISTLRLLHYPPQPPAPAKSNNPHNNVDGGGEEKQQREVKLCCTPHTDSGILTLLHQDATGGLEVQNASGGWVAAPYLSGSLVVNIGDLMARVSGGRYVATMHRVRASGIEKGEDGEDGEDGEEVMGRFSVPFFFEPGEECLVRSVDEGDEGVNYGEHIRAKMDTWVEFQGKG